MAYAMCLEQKSSAVLYCAAILPHQKPLLSLLLQGELYTLSPPSGTGHFSCILAELCWLEQFPPLALVPCPSPPVGTGRKMKVIFILPHSWQDEECWALCFLCVIRTTRITSFRSQKQGDFTEIWDLFYFIFLIPVMFLKLTWSHMRGVSTICQQETKASKRAMMNCLAWRIHGLQRWK